MKSRSTIIYAQLFFTCGETLSQTGANLCTWHHAQLCATFFPFIMFIYTCNNLTHSQGLDFSLDFDVDIQNCCFLTVTNAQSMTRLRNGGKLFKMMNYGFLECSREWRNHVLTHLKKFNFQYHMYRYRVKSYIFLPCRFLCTLIHVQISQLLILLFCRCWSVIWQLLTLSDRNSQVYSKQDIDTESKKWPWLSYDRKIM